MNVIDLTDKNKDFPVFVVVQLGCGGNGSHFFRSFLQDCRTYYDSHINSRYYRKYRIPFGLDITLVDGDKVERKNLGNQLFGEEDIDQYKVDALADRYGVHYNFDVKAVNQYVKDIDTLSKLFPNFDHRYSDSNVIPVIIGMLDNNRTRQLLHNFFFSDHLETLIWLDAGIEGMAVIEDQNIGDEERMKIIQNSGWSGQVVAGLKYKGEIVLEPVTIVYPDIYEDARSSFPGESCGDLIVNHPQRSATNKFAAQVANNFMNNLLNSLQIHWHYCNFNAKMCNSRSELITSEQVNKYKRFAALA
jgi:hypothetical protein